MGAGGRQGGRERERSVFSVGGRSPGGGAWPPMRGPTLGGASARLGGLARTQYRPVSLATRSACQIMGAGAGSEGAGLALASVSPVLSRPHATLALTPPSRRRRGRIKKLTARQGHAAGRRFSLPVHGVSGGGLCGRTRAHAWERRGSGGREESGASCVCGGDELEKEKGECGRRTADERAQRPPASTTAVCSPSHYRHNATRDFLRPNPARPSLRVSHPLRDAARVGADKRHARHHKPGDRHHV